MVILRLYDMEFIEDEVSPALHDVQASSSCTQSSVGAGVDREFKSVSRSAGSSRHSTTQWTRSQAGSPPEYETNDTFPQPYVTPLRSKSIQRQTFGQNAASRYAIQEQHDPEGIYSHEFTRPSQPKRYDSAPLFREHKVETAVWEGNKRILTYETRERSVPARKSISPIISGESYPRTPAVSGAKNVDFYSRAKKASPNTLVVERDEEDVDDETSPMMLDQARSGDRSIYLEMDMDKRGHVNANTAESTALDHYSVRRLDHEWAENANEDKSKSIAPTMRWIDASATYSDTSSSQEIETTYASRVLPIQQSSMRSGERNAVNAATSFSGQPTSMNPHATRIQFLFQNASSPLREPHMICNAYSSASALRSVDSPYYFTRKQNEGGKPQAYPASSRSSSLHLADASDFC